MTAHIHSTDPHVIAEHLGEVARELYRISPDADRLIREYAELVPVGDDAVTLKTAFEKAKSTIESLHDELSTIRTVAIEQDSRRDYLADKLDEISRCVRDIRRHTNKARANLLAEDSDEFPLIEAMVDSALASNPVPEL